MIKVLRICGTLCWFVLFASQLFISCASTSVEPEPKTPVVYVTNLKKINILSADKIERNIDEVQFFEGAFSDKSFAMPIYIQADENGINLSVLNDFGTSMGDITFKNDSVEFESALFSENVKAEYIVWDVQLALYKTEEISNCLSKNKLAFVSENDGETETRKILDGKELIEEITIRKNYIGIKNHLRKYEYHLIGVGDE
ncbi:DUF3261 domain-containing protein [Treponema sp.]|uniref:DUF3261 domain-containing protein n=1 Tax=Treponema sp. TaxID=166 RepID=UPI00298E9104|nr:DUF3261 domain-containing protein [Treponema sp.]MCI6442181.1 DUF3261 domain-containing protein [Spirochaetia bacterium]MDY4133478.1 DUF3261 domain-containing protein [Treponema sp.]